VITYEGLREAIQQTYPDCDVEIQVRSVRNQLASLLAKGCSVGAHVDPGERRVEIHRPGAEPLVLAEDAALEVPELLPGFGFPIGELWPE
jgi:Uma2 family endonuclease